MDAGFTLKQIADHLGHRSMNSTRIYTKIDMQGLRQVAELDYVAHSHAASQSLAENYAGLPMDWGEFGEPGPW